MKFYFNNKLVRTSKTHHYTHGVFTANNRLLGCASSYELALKSIATNTSTDRHNLDYYKAQLKAIDSGRDYFWTGAYKHKVDLTRQEVFEMIEWLEQYLAGIHIEKLIAVE